MARKREMDNMRGNNVHEHPSHMFMITSFVRTFGVQKCKKAHTQTHSNTLTKIILDHSTTVTSVSVNDNPNKNRAK